MVDPKTALLSRILAKVVADLSSGAGGATAWAEARQALDATKEDDTELRAAVESTNLDALRTIVEEWGSGARRLPEQDRAVLKRAMKAYKKRLKLTRLDAESSIAGGPLSTGRGSGIVAITPPVQYPREVWDELVRRGRLVDDGHGMLELPPE